MTKNEYRREWYKKNSDKDKEYTRRWSRNIRHECLMIYGGRCVCCGESHSEFLTIDHIDGNGRSHRKSIKKVGGVHFYLWLKNQGWPRDKYQLLCWNCNTAKHFFKICPHQQEKAQVA